MNKGQLGLVGLSSLAAVVLMTPEARADAIDGDWCADDGRHISINGSAVVTPGGAQLDVPYDRHTMSYTVPASEPGAGELMALRVVSDNELRVALAIVGSETETWRRCEFTS